MRIYFRWVFVFIGLGLLSFQNIRGEEKPLWELGLGVAALRMPDYRGSDESRNYLLPYPYLIYRGDFLKIDKDTISGRLFKTDRLLLDISLFGNMPVDSDENSARNGMPDLDPTFQVGPSLEIKLLENKQEEYKVTLALPVRAVYGFDFPSLYQEGWVCSPKLEFEKADIIPDSGLNLWASAGPLFVTRAYHAYYYSVEPAYATPTRPAYTAEGGYSGSVISVGLNKQYKKFSVNAFVNMDFLQNAAIEDSPLVKDRSTMIYGISVSRLFMKSKRTVTTDR